MILYVEDKNKGLIIQMGHQELHQERIRCITFLDRLCRRYGSTYEGRRQAACSFLHIRQKAPIVIHESLVLFPTVSQDDPMCVWINYCLVKKVEELTHQTKVIFMNGVELIVDLEYRSILKQMRRCEHYMYALQLHHTSSWFLNDDFRNLKM